MNRVSKRDDEEFAPDGQNARSVNAESQRANEEDTRRGLAGKEAKTMSREADAQEIPAPSDIETADQDAGGMMLGRRNAGRDDLSDDPGEVRPN